MEKGHRIGIVDVKQVRFEDISSHVISCDLMWIYDCKVLLYNSTYFG